MASSIFTVLFVATIFITTVLHSSSVTSDHGDYNILITLKHSLGDPPYLSSWKPNTDCCNSWRGIECEYYNHHVTSIDMEFAPDVAGILPPVIGNLTYLRNFFMQHLPGLHGPIPSSIGNLARLQSLTIDSTGVSGEILLPGSGGGRIPDWFITEHMKRVTGRPSTIQCYQEIRD